MEEPSVLDYVKSRLFPWKYGRLELPPVDQAGAQPGPAPASQAGSALISGQTRAAAFPAEEQTRESASAWPWRGLSALILALAAQLLLEPPGERSWEFSLLLYLAAAGALGWSYLSGEWQLAPARPAVQRYRGEQVALSRPRLLGIAVPLALAAFLAFGDNRFTTLNTGLWLVSILLFLAAFWQGNPLPVLQNGARSLLSRNRWRVSISSWTLTLLSAVALVLFFRLYQLNTVPPEMNSDHAEKLLDVIDVLQGRTAIFFPRNTGREFFQFYLTAAVIQLFNTGISYLSLKIGTAIAGLVTVVYIYRLGKEIANRETGLWAAVLAGIAYWPNVITRVGLRFSLYPLFVAPTLFYLLRGIRRSRLNDFLLAGLCLGLGLNGYSSFRIVPFVVTIAVGLYLLHGQSEGDRQATSSRFLLLAAAALLVFLPLLRYALQNPEMFAYRAFTRLSDWEQPLPGPAWLIFLNNLWKSWIMPFWDNGSIWLHSVPYRPALSVVSAVLYFMGTVLLVVRYLRRRHWLDLFLLLATPLLMMPSILSLAFPGENPSLNRSAGAIIPVFLVAALGLESITSTLRARLVPPYGSRVAWAVALLLVAGSALQDYDLVFDQYFSQYSLSSWNSSEMGEVIRGYADTVGSRDSAWVVSYPHWVDTRLVGMTAGFPTRDFGILISNLESTRIDPGPKLFLVNTNDTEAQATLSNLYPQGWFSEYPSKVETKNFLIYFVPPQN